MIHIIAGWLGLRPKNVNKKSQRSKMSILSSTEVCWKIIVGSLALWTQLTFSWWLYGINHQFHFDWIKPEDHFVNYCHQSISMQCYWSHSEISLLRICVTTPKWWKSSTWNLTTRVFHPLFGINMATSICYTLHGVKTFMYSK